MRSELNEIYNYRIVKKRLFGEKENQLKVYNFGSHTAKLLIFRAALIYQIFAWRGMVWILINVCSLAETSVCCNICPSFIESN